MSDEAEQLDFDGKPARSARPDRAARSGLQGLAATLREEARTRGMGDEADYIDPLRAKNLTQKAEAELVGLESAEELREDMQSGDARFARQIRARLVEQLCDFDRYPDDLFDMIRKLRKARDLRLLEQLKAADDYRLFPAWIQREMSTVRGRVHLLSHLELGVPYWELEAVSQRETLSALQQKSYQAQDTMGAAAAAGLRGSRPKREPQ